MEWLCRRCGETVTRPLRPSISCPGCDELPVWTNAQEYDGPEFWKLRNHEEAGGGGSDAR